MDFRDYKPKKGTLLNIGGYDLEIRPPKSELAPLVLDIQRDIEKERLHLELAKKRGEPVSDEMSIPPDTVRKIIKGIYLSLKNSYPEKADKEIMAFIDENLDEIMKDMKFLLFFGIDPKTVNANNTSPQTLKKKE